MLENVRTEVRRLVRQRGIGRRKALVFAEPLTPEQAIGRPSRKDYPIIKGKERVLEARVLGARGQAFTDSPCEFTGTVDGVLQLPFTSNRNRAIFVAVVNALCRALGMAEGTVHCKDDEPEQCGSKIAAHILERWGRVRVGLFGFNPAIAQKLIRVFGRGRTRIADLDDDNIGSVKSGVKIEDGETASEDIIRWSDVCLITGTTLLNGTFDSLAACAKRHGTDFLIYGMTVAGVSSLTGLPRQCYFGRNE
ncbi:MAG: DUF364 domain-containing protein [Elusimicrobiota bacterium]